MSVRMCVCVCERVHVVFECMAALMYVHICKHMLCDTCVFESVSVCECESVSVCKSMCVHVGASV